MFFVFLLFFCLAEVLSQFFSTNENECSPPTPHHTPVQRQHNIDDHKTKGMNIAKYISHAVRKFELEVEQSEVVQCYILL